MKSVIAKEKFLEEQGWVRFGSNSWVKREWQNEPETLGLEAHLCPHWYCSELFEDAYIIAVTELAVNTAVKNLKEEYAAETAMLLERILLDATQGLWWSDVRSAVKGFSKEKLYHWYLSVCGKPNPFIVKAFE
jgi:hypothetical protein